MPRLADKLQRALYRYAIQPFPVFQPQLEVFACRHFGGLPAYLRVRQLYRLKHLKRAQYYLGIRRAFSYADKLGLDRFSILEFGVAEGNGLLYLQNLLNAIAGGLSPKSVKIFGFDTFSGLPSMEGSKDGTSVWKEGDYPSDLAKLKALIDPQIVTPVPGLFSDSVPQVAADLIEYPPLFIIVDCDLYTSTLSIFENLFPVYVPPLSYWYFDDTGLNFFSERVGEKLAIREFNAQAGNPFEFIPDYRALSEPLEHDTVLQRLFNCVNNETFVDLQRQSQEVQRIPLNPKLYSIYEQPKQ